MPRGWDDPPRVGRAAPFGSLKPDCNVERGLATDLVEDEIGFGH
jgi:hypothetical protein